MMFRREMRRDERRDVVEVAAVGEAVHVTKKEHEEQAELAEAQQAQAAQAQAAEQAPAAAAPPAEAAAQAPAATSAGDLTEEQVNELERVAKLKEEGILTDDEFAAEKKKILGL